MKYLGILLILFGFSEIKAQEVTDYDLQNFAYAYSDMMKLNNKAQKEMADIIEKEGLDLELYHAIDESKDSEYIPDVADEEFEKYDKVQPKILAVMNKFDEAMEKSFKKHDLTKQKYKAIAERVKQDYILQAKLEKMMTRLR
ncbi:MAG: DUF4168 domain-containing protein [Weeksellaceae bacterium]